MLSRRRATIAGQWILLGGVVGVLCGIASAIFLAALERVTHFRTTHEFIVYTLPVAGLVVGALYEWFGGPIKGGYNLVLDTLHTDGKQVPVRMAPMVLIGTVLTHLFGGSAGREGTAVQMGSSLADGVAHALGLKGHSRRQVLAAGIAGGFGSVFGTPIAGTLFGLEVIRVGKIEYDALLPSLVAAIIGDVTTRALGISHTPYPMLGAFEMTPLVFGKWIVFGIACGVVTYVFVELLHRLKKLLEKRVARLPIRMALGGITVVAMWKICGTSDYLGLGVPTIIRSFSDAHLPWGAFAWKLVFTAVTIGAGFLGGEVTPLFFVGAALGNVLGRLLGIPIDLAAGIGLAAVFGAAANTPFSLSIMAVELLGAHAFPHVFIVAVVAYIASGHRSIYPAQRVGRAKLATKHHDEVPLREWQEHQDEHVTDSLRIRAADESKDAPKEEAKPEPKPEPKPEVAPPRDENRHQP
jgi:H+/Cl- antiporter ClcA